MIWKDPNKEEPIQSVPLIIILKWADLTWADGGVDIAYTDEYGFQGSNGCFEKEDIHYWCYIHEMLKEIPFPMANSVITNDDCIPFILKEKDVVFGKKEKTP